MKHFLGCMIIIAMASSGSLAGEAERHRLGVKKNRNAIAMAQSRDDAKLALGILFSHLTDEEMAVLADDADVGISLWAAYYSRFIPHATARAASHPERFIGFLEGRGGARCPAHWASTLVMAEYSDDMEPTILKLYGPAGYVMKGGRDNGLPEAEGGVVISTPTKRLDEQRRLKVGEFVLYISSNPFANDSDHFTRTLSLPIHETFLAELREARSAGFGKCDIVFAGDRALVTCSDDFGTQFPLVCLDRRNGRVAWKAKVWAEYDLRPSIFGATWQVVDVIAGRDTVTVFGVLGSRLPYAESFRLDSGKPIYRFNPRWRLDIHK